jgi:hypothetical protein
LQPGVRNACNARRRARCFNRSRTLRTGLFRAFDAHAERASSTGAQHVSVR